MMNMRKIRHFMFWVGVGLLCVSACKKKNSEDPPVPIDEAAIRLNGDWYLPEAGGVC